MRLFSYVVARDYGFAPNPFYGVCTLATCKPRIRKVADIGDWVVGTGSKTRGRGGHLVYVMRVSEAMSFNAYWNAPRFRQKRPNLRGSLKQGYGDNIYFKDDNGQWHQHDSHHSCEDGTPDLHNIKRDTQSDRVLIGEEYAYWGVGGPEIPGKFRGCNGVDICIGGPGHQSRFPPGLADQFIRWFHSLNIQGYLDDLLDWP